MRQSMQRVHNKHLVHDKYILLHVPMWKQIHRELVNSRLMPICHKHFFLTQTGFFPVHYFLTKSEQSNANQPRKLYAAHWGCTWHLFTICSSSCLILITCSVLENLVHGSLSYLWFCFCLYSTNFKGVVIICKSSFYVIPFIPGRLFGGEWVEVHLV